MLALSCANIDDMSIPFQIICNCYTEVFDVFSVFRVTDDAFIAETLVWPIFYLSYDYFFFS